MIIKQSLVGVIATYQVHNLLLHHPDYLLHQGHYIAILRHIAAGEMQLSGLVVNNTATQHIDEQE